MKSKVLVLGLIMLLAVLADNVTTVLALQSGAVELNPIVSFFTSSSELFILFTIMKCAIAFFVVVTSRFEKPSDYVVYFVVLLFFLQASIVNLINSW